LRWFIIHYEVPNRSELPREFEDDLRAALAQSGGQDLRIAGQTESAPELLAFSLRLPAESEQDAAQRGNDLLPSVFGGELWAVVGVTPSQDD
jgi:hypothetical protein